jgi:ELWxxDGT repeat protein
MPFDRVRRLISRSGKSQKKTFLRGSRKVPTHRRMFLEQFEARCMLATLIDINNKYYDSSPSDYVELNGNLIFTAYTVTEAVSGATDHEVWLSNGTSTGTTRLKDIRPGATGSSAQGYVRAGSQVFFLADDGFTGMDLYRTDGTANGTFRVKDLAGTFGANKLTPLGNNVVFVSSDSFGSELWVSDGTLAGTIRISDINPSGGSEPTLLTVVGDSVYFAARETTSGSHVLWKTNGTATGTVRVPRDAANSPIVVGTLGSGSMELTAVGNTLYFTGNDAQGRELWRTDGTLAGTGIVKDISSFSSNPSDLTAFGNQLLFRANDDSGTKLWVTDGTAANTQMLAAISAFSLTEHVGAGLAYFSVNSSGGGTDLWKTDGTVAGTQVLVSNITTFPSGVLLRDFVAPDGKFYFGVKPSAAKSDSELWRTDGTSIGTVRVIPGVTLNDNVGHDIEFASLNGRMFFTGKGGAAGFELWTTRHHAV